MEKAIIPFKPEIKDYHKVMRSYFARKRIYWISLGIYIALTLAILFLTILALLGGGKLRSAVIFWGPILLLFVLFAMWPVIGGWLTVRSATKKEQLTLPVTYEIDSEKILISNALADVKYSWNVFSHAYENDEYFFLIPSLNLNMFHFLPKQAFSSVNEEEYIRSLVVEKLGGIENIQRGLTGWKLTLLVAFVLSLLLTCIGGGYVIYTYVLDSATPSSIVL